MEYGIYYQDGRAVELDDETHDIDYEQERWF